MNLRRDLCPSPATSPRTRWRRLQRGRSRGYTLIEMLTTIAVLIIFLGLMVSLARRVRAQSADSVTKGLLVRLDRLMTQYIDRHPDTVPAVTPFLGDHSKLDEASLQRAALANNREFLRLLRTQEDLSAKVFADLPTSIYDEVTLRDAWGTPIVYMGTYHPAVGTAPKNRSFFFSAGPDGHYLTKADNLYSYESPIPKE